MVTDYRNSMHSNRSNDQRSTLNSKSVISNNASKVHYKSTPTIIDETSSMKAKKSAKMLAVKVMMLDDTFTIFQIQIKALGRVLFDEVCKQLNLLEADYFGLEYQGSDNIMYWLDLEKPINRQISLSLIDVTMKFCVKFYTPDPSQLEEEYTRYLFCLNIKLDLSQGSLQCNENTAALIASYIVQAECGDFVPEDYPDHSYLACYKFIPNQTEGFLKRIMENHKKHIGQPPAEADLNVLETARRCELYGTKMHPAKDCEGGVLNLSVAHMGIVVFQNLTKINTFSWAKIRKISFKRKRFLIKFHAKEYEHYKDIVEFFFDSRNECKNFWKKCVEHHSFYRCISVKHVSRHRRRVLSRGSSFRYSGKTQKEVVEFVRENFVKRQSFQRSTSFRHSALYSSSANVCTKPFGSSVSAHPLIPLIDSDADDVQVNHLDVNRNRIVDQKIGQATPIFRSSNTQTSNTKTLNMNGAMKMSNIITYDENLIKENGIDKNSNRAIPSPPPTITIQASVHDSKSELTGQKYFSYNNNHNHNNSNQNDSNTFLLRDRVKVKMQSEPNLRDQEIINENFEHETSLQFAYSTLQFISTPKQNFYERRTKSCKEFLNDSSLENEYFAGMRLESPITRYDDQGSYRSLYSNFSSKNPSLEIQQDIIVPYYSHCKTYPNSYPNSIISNTDYNDNIKTFLACSQEDLTTQDSYEIIDSNEDDFNYQRYRYHNPQRSLSLDSRNYYYYHYYYDNDNKNEFIDNELKFKSISDIYFKNNNSISIDDLIFLPKEINPRNSDGSFYSKLLKNCSNSEPDNISDNNTDNSCKTNTPLTIKKDFLKSETPHVHSISLKNVEKSSKPNYKEIFKELEPLAMIPTIERTKSDPNCISSNSMNAKRYGVNLRRHMLMHQKSIDLTPAESSDEDYLLKQIPSAPPLIKSNKSHFEMPSIISVSELKKNHADVTYKLHKINLTSDDMPQKDLDIGKQLMKRDILKMDLDAVEEINMKLSRIDDDSLSLSRNNTQNTNMKLKHNTNIKIKRNPKSKKSNSIKTLKNKVRITSFSSDDESLDSDVVFGASETLPIEPEFSPPQTRKELENILRFEQIRQSHAQFTMSSTEIEGSPPQPRKKADKNYLSLLYQQHLQQHQKLSDKSFSITSSEDDYNKLETTKLYKTYEETIPEENLSKSFMQNLNKRANVQLLFAHARLNLSEGSAMSELQKESTVYSPTAGRRAKSLDAPIIPVNRLPSSNAFSFKDDTVEDDEKTIVQVNQLKSLQVPEIKRSKSEDNSPISPKKSSNKKSRSLEKYDRVNDSAKRLEKQQLLYEMAIKEQKLEKNSPVFGETTAFFPKIEEKVRESGGKLEILIDTYETTEIPLENAIIITKSPKHLDKLAKSLELNTTSNSNSKSDNDETCVLNNVPRLSKSFDESVSLKNDENVLLQGTSLDIWLSMSKKEKLMDDIEIIQKEKSGDFFEFGDLEEKPNVSLIKSHSDDSWVTIDVSDTCNTIIENNLDFEAINNNNNKKTLLSSPKNDIEVEDQNAISACFHDFDNNNVNIVVNIDNFTDPIFISRTLSRISEKSSNSEKSSELLEDITIIDSFNEEENSIICNQVKTDQNFSQIKSKIDLKRQNSDDTSINEFDFISDDIENWPLPELPKDIPEQQSHISDAVLQDDVEWPSPPSSFFEVPLTIDLQTPTIPIPSLTSSSALSASSSSSSSLTDSNFQSTTIKNISLPQKLKSNHDSNSEDTSLGLTMSEWSNSNTNTVKFIENSHDANITTTTSSSKLKQNSGKKSCSSLGDFTLSDSSITVQAPFNYLDTIILSSSSTDRPVRIPFQSSKSETKSISRNFISDQSNMKTDKKRSNSFKFINKTATFPLIRPTSYKKKAIYYFRNTSKSSNDSTSSQDSHSCHSKSKFRAIRKRKPILFRKKNEKNLNNESKNTLKNKKNLDEGYNPDADSQSGSEVHKE